jgi:hypothetical protein
VRFGTIPDLSDNDGVVPTLSHVWGEVVHCATADHLDVVGHYGRDVPGEVYADWLPSHSGFDDAAFGALWSAVARFITRAAVEGGEKLESQAGADERLIQNDSTVE